MESLKWHGSHITATDKIYIYYNSLQKNYWINDASIVHVHQSSFKHAVIQISIINVVMYMYIVVFCRHTCTCSVHVHT